MKKRMKTCFTLHLVRIAVLAVKVKAIHILPSSRMTGSLEDYGKTFHKEPIVADIVYSILKFWTHAKQRRWTQQSSFSSNLKHAAQTPLFECKYINKNSSRKTLLARLDQHLVPRGNILSYSANLSNTDGPDSRCFQRS